MLIRDNILRGLSFVISIFEPAKNDRLLILL